MLLGVYGIPLCNLIGFALFYAYVRWVTESGGGSDRLLRQHLPWLMYLSFGLAMLWYVACIAGAGPHWRTVQDSMEIKQVKCVLFGIVLSMFPISFLYTILATPSALRGRSGHLADVRSRRRGHPGLRDRHDALSRLMELDKIINSSIGYFLVSFLAGLMYYGVVFVGTFSTAASSPPTLPAALTVSTYRAAFRGSPGPGPRRFKTVLDRRFRNKSQLDQTLQQMSQAVSQLVDPPALAQRAAQHDCRLAECQPRGGFCVPRKRGDFDWPPAGETPALQNSRPVSRSR